MKRDIRVVVVLGSLGLLLASTACRTPVGLAPSTTPMENRTYQVIGPTQGESCAYGSLIVPLVGDASLRSALREAKEKVNADELINVVVDSFELYTLLFNKKCTIVRGLGVRMGPGSAPVPQRDSTPQAPPPRPYLETVPAVPAVPALPGHTSPITRTVGPEPARSEEKKPAKLTPAERRKMEQEEKKRAIEEKKRVEEERRREADQAKRDAEERKKTEEADRRRGEEEKRQVEIFAKQKAEEDARQAEARRLAEEEAKPVPDDFKVFCKYSGGDAIRVEMKGQVLEAEFVKCLYFGVRVKQHGQEPAVIPFEQIWNISKGGGMVEPVPAPPEAPPAKPSGPARPKKR